MTPPSFSVWSSTVPAVFVQWLDADADRLALGLEPREELLRSRSSGDRGHAETEELRNEPPTPSYRCGATR